MNESLSWIEFIVFGHFTCTDVNT